MTTPTTITGPATKRLPSLDLEDRALQFAADVRAFVKQLPRVIGSGENENGATNVHVNGVTRNDDLKGPQDWTWGRTRDGDQRLRHFAGRR